MKLNPIGEGWKEDTNGSTDSVKISDHERRVTDRLAVAWNEFNALQPMEDESKAEFRRAINSALAIIALRVAYRVNPECWTPPSA